jgi:hypothetical protein
MRYGKAVAGATVMVLWASVAAAQAKPNFAGKWQLDQEKTQAANPNMGGGGGGGGGGRGGFGGPMTLAVDNNTLTITRETPNGAVNTAYKLDGSEQTITMGQGEAKATAKWEGNTIVVNQTRQGQNGEVKSTIVYSIEGDYLVVANTGPGRGGGEPVTRKSYYKKA